MAVVAGHPLHAEPAGQRLLQMLGGDRRDRAEVLVVAEGVRGPPFPVGACSGSVGDLGVDVQLHVTVPGGVLQPVRHRQVGLVPLAGLPAVHPGVMRPGARVAGLPLEVAEARPDGSPDHRVDLVHQPRPVLVPRLIPGQAGQPGVLPERGVEDRDRLRQRQGQVEVQRAQPRLPGSFQPQLTLTLGGRLRLGGQQPGVDAGGVPPAARRPAQRGAVGRLALAEQQVVRAALNYLAGLKAERPRARTPPAAGRLPAALAGLDVIPGRILGCAAVDLAPDVVQVIALGQGRDNRQTDLYPRRPEAAELTMIIRWCMGVTDWKIMDQG